MIEYSEARALVLEAARLLPSESVPLAAALGRTLGRDVKAREDIPPFTKATMDGYAVRSEDTSPGPGTSEVRLGVVADLPAGRLPHRAVGRGQAVRIMTGAPLPGGADAVVMVEDTSSDE